MSLGELVHGEQRRDDLRTEAGVVNCLESAGLPATLYADALSDASTELDLIAEHRAAKDRLSAFGVPTIALEGSDIGRSSLTSAAAAGCAVPAILTGRGVRLPHPGR